MSRREELEVVVPAAGDEARLCALAEILSGETQSDLVEESL